MSAIATYHTPSLREGAADEAIQGVSRNPPGVLRWVRNDGWQSAQETRP